MRWVRIMGLSADMADTQSISGSCSCGNITWTSTSPPQHLDYCYCLTCQKVSGAPFQAWMGIPKGSLKWSFTRSQPFIYRSGVGDTDISVAERTCCGSCGCNISIQYYLYPEKTHVAASTTDKNDFEALRVGCHIWTKQVPAWYSIPEDGSERHREFDPDFEAKLQAYLKVERSKPNGLKLEGGWWAGLMPGDAPDYTTVNGPDDLTMADIWNDPEKVRRSE